MVSAAVLFFIPAIISLILYSIIGQVLVIKRRHRGRNQVLTVALLISCVFWAFLGVFTYFARFIQGPKGSFLGELQHTLTVCVTGWQEWMYDCENQPTFNQVTYSLHMCSALFVTFSAFANSFCLLIVVKKFWDPLIHLWRFIARSGISSSSALGDNNHL